MRDPKVRVPAGIWCLVYLAELVIKSCKELHGNIYADGKDCRFKRLESAYRIDAAIHIRDYYA